MAYSILVQEEGSGDMFVEMIARLFLLLIEDQLCAGYLHSYLRE